MKPKRKSLLKCVVHPPPSSSFVTALEVTELGNIKIPFPHQNFHSHWLPSESIAESTEIHHTCDPHWTGGKAPPAEEASVVMCYLISSATDFSLFNFPFDFNIDLLKTTVIKTNCTGKLVFVCSCTSTYKAASV